MFCVFQNTSDNQIDKNFILAQQLAVYVHCTDSIVLWFVTAVNYITAK